MTNAASSLQDAALAMDALRIDAATQGELGTIFAAFKGEVVATPGVRAPADPGLCRKPPDGDSTGEALASSSCGYGCCGCLVAAVAVRSDPENALNAVWHWDSH